VPRKPLLSILLSASLFGLSPPLAKLLVEDISPVALAGLLYLGSFAGLTIYRVVRRASRFTVKKAAPLETKDIPWLFGAILSGGILGPICLMMGLRFISGFSASLLLNLEGLATALIAVLIFKENTGKRFWLALTCMTLAGVILSWNPELGRFTLKGPLLVTAAMVCWGLDNNLTCNISDKDPIQITQIKGFFAGGTCLFLAVLLKMTIPLEMSLLLALLLGSFSYGLSLVLFIKALKGLGSSRTGAFFSLAPFVGAVFSVIVLREWLGWVMFPAAGLMIIGVYLIWLERHSHRHFHARQTHAHSHSHDDGHHLHSHPARIEEPHAHEHTHHETEHIHGHWPDTHHRHQH
jgi:drug/metabolite transporter (DMT)-like permease